MKRILSFVLVLVMCLSLLAACGEPAETTAAPAGGSVEDAKDYLAAMYKDTDGTVARRDFSVVAVVMIDGVSYPVTWTTDAPDFVTIGAAQNNMVTIDIVEEPAEQVTFKLTGTVTDKDGKTASATFTRIIEAKKVTGIEFVKAPEVGTAYKFALQQNNLGKTLFFTGAMSGNYLAMSENPFEAVDVFVEDVEGGQRIYFMAGEVKTYVDVVPRGADNPGKVNVVLTEAPTCVFTWDADRKTFTTTVDGNNWYLGTYNTYNTISASNTSYIENLEVIGATQFPAGFATVNIVAEQVKEPAADTAYKFAVQQNNLGQTLYFTGEMNVHALEVGAQVTVRGPYGRNFPVEEDFKGKDLLFIAGGIGLAPLRSVINYVRHYRANYGKVVIVYGARSKDDLVDIDEIQNEWVNEPNMEVYLTIDRPQEGWDGHVGFVPAYVKELGLDPNMTAVLCGPPIMIKFTLAGLLELGFDKSRVYTTLELRMKCGVGKCGRCNVGDKFVCKDGPVFRMTELDELPDEY